MNKLSRLPELLFFLFFITLILRSEAESKYPKVTLGHGGSIVGQTVTIDGVQVREFLGIPYAEPPTGLLRFAKPMPKRWTGTLSTSTLRSTCWQPTATGFDINNKGAKIWAPNTKMSEDCLHLHVWAPVMENGGTKLPVMVWIHGGGFISGSANLQVYRGRFLAAKEKVIVVGIQYRVGAFGFLYLDPYFGGNDRQDMDLAPGNMGLWDQKLALEWVQQNIHLFNGDQDTVTIFGESAGAVSVSLLWLSPLTQHLFKRAILQSSTAYARWALYNVSEARSRADVFAKACNCTLPSVNRLESLQCLQNVPAETLVEKLDAILEDLGEKRLNTLSQCLADPGQRLDPHNLPGWSTSTRLYFDTPLRPVIDGYLIPKSVDDMFDDQHLKKAPEILIGTNKNEGMYFLLYGLRMNQTTFLHPDGKVELPKPIELAAKNQTLNNETANLTWVAYSQFISRDWMKKGVADLVPYYYNIGKDFTKTSGRVLMERLDNLTGDMDFICPTLKFADQVAKLSGSKVYLYKFTKRTQGFTMPSWVGVMHGSEIEYVFGMPHNDFFTTEFYKFTEDEKKISNDVMAMWANFARTGNPSIQATSKDSNGTWPAYFGHEAPWYMVIGDKLKPKRGFYECHCHLWSEKLPKLAYCSGPCQVEEGNLEHVQ